MAGGKCHWEETCGGSCFQRRYDHVHLAGEVACSPGHGGLVGVVGCKGLVVFRALIRCLKSWHRCADVVSESWLDDGLLDHGNRLVPSQLDLQNECCLKFAGKELVMVLANKTCVTSAI